MNCNLDLTAIVVTSPFVSMPSTSIINCVISSFDLIDGLNEVPVLIVMDGCLIGFENRTKKGRITDEAMHLYDEYHVALQEQFKGPRFKILRSESHLGFAHAVKLGLENCATTYALIAQHDRTFCEPFGRLKDLLIAMEKHEHIRYVGFPTGNNIAHDRTLHTRYHLNNLNKQGIKIDLGHNLYLQPLIFWFDSQHLAHVKRYLEIFQPYRHLPVHLREVIGVATVKVMLLKPGDFIEDKFGQAQRNVLFRLREEGHPDTLIDEMFKWFGSYLCWMNDGESPFDATVAQDKPCTLLMVSHLDARSLDMERIAQFAHNFGDGILKNNAYNRLKTFETATFTSLES